MVLLSISLLMGGCSLMNMVNQNDKKDKGNEENVLEQFYVPVQEYVGESFELKGSNPKTGEIAEAHREEVEKAVKNYFLKHYKTEVKVNNIISSKDAVSVIVESEGNIEFYSKAFVPVDVQNNEVDTKHVWSLEGDIEGAITSGLYVKAFQKEFDQLDKVLEEVAEEHGLVGERIEVMENTQGKGYQGPYYLVTSSFEHLYELYLENPEISQKELSSSAIEFLNDHDYNLSEFNGVPIRLYLDTPGTESTDELIDQIYEEISSEEGLPGGRYIILLNDNNIDSRDAIGDKPNSLTSIFHMEGDL